MRRARWKRKNVRDELAGKAVNSPKTGAGRHELLTELETPLPAALYLNLNQCATASAGMEHNGVQIGHPLLLFPLPLPHPTPGGVSKGEGPCPRPPSPWEGFPKGRDRSPAPLCHEGAWGTGGVPHVSGGGLRGRGLCAKGPFPLPRSGNCPLREQTVLSDFQIK